MLARPLHPHDGENTGAQGYLPTGKRALVCTVSQDPLLHKDPFMNKRGLDHPSSSIVQFSTSPGPTYMGACLPQADRGWLVCMISLTSLHAQHHLLQDAVQT